MRIVHASDWHGHKMGLVSGKLPEGDLSGLARRSWWTYRKAMKIDLITAKGNITEHEVDPDRAGKTICGLRIGLSQPASGNAPCRGCERYLRQRGERRAKEAA